MMGISNTAKRGLAAAIAVALATGVAAVPAYRSGTARAFADEARTEMVRSYRQARVWRADVEERERRNDGGYRSTRHRLAIAGPDRYRIESVELDEEGREVVSVTLRNGTTVYASTRSGGGDLRVLEIRNVPPDLGAVADNLLGQQVSRLSRERAMRFEGRDTVRGRAAVRLSVDAGHLVWLDGDSSIPLREQIHSGDTLVHELEVLHFESGGTIDESEFDPASLGATAGTVEDLGFRETDPVSAPVDVLGFEPKAFDMQGGWRLLVAGHIDPDVRSEGSPALPVWTALYDSPAGPVLVSQWLSAGDPGFEGQTSDGTLGPLVTEVSGRRVAYYSDEWRTHATTQVGDVLVAIESALPADDVLAMMAWIR